jgi:hypothetical protein
MKQLIAFVAALFIAIPAVAAPKKEKDKEKEDKKKTKEVPAQMWTVVVEGAKPEVGGQEVKTYLSSIKNVKVESCEQKDKIVEAVISSKERISRSDVSKVLKENKELKVKEFKVKRPDKDADKEKEKEESKEEKKTEEPKKEESKEEEKSGEKEKSAEKEMKEKPTKEKE